MTKSDALAALDNAKEEVDETRTNPPSQPLNHISNSDPSELSHST